MQKQNYTQRNDWRIKFTPQCAAFSPTEIFSRNLVKIEAAIILGMERFYDSRATL